MQQIQINGLNLWQFSSLMHVPEIKHFVSARNTSKKEEEFTLSLSSTPNREIVLANRNSLAAALGIATDKLFFPSQVHGTRIVEVNSNTSKEQLMEADALICNEKNICIAVLSADCVTILLYDARNGAVGAVHAGWRGTVAKILEKTLQLMQQTYGSRGADIIACLGPSVCQDSYEVGTEVIEEVEQAFGRNRGLLIHQANKKARLDLWKANKLQLMEFGVPETSIETSELCTVKNNDLFFSARKGDAGRFAAGIMML